MQWFYLQKDERHGPIEESEFLALIERGVIASDTFVWRRGMQNWEKCQDTLARDPVANPGDPGPARCIECGRHFSPAQLIQFPFGTVCEACKPMIVRRIGEGILPTHSELVRQENFKFEQSVRSIGVLYLLAGTLFIVGAIAALNILGLGGIVWVIPSLIVGGGLIWLSNLLQSLDPLGQKPALIISIIGMLLFPIGTVLGGYALVLLLCKRGRYIYSDEYRQIISDTPEIKNQMKRWLSR
jgi:hypothetical protein